MNGFDNVQNLDPIPENKIRSAYWTKNQENVKLSYSHDHYKYDNPDIADNIIHFHAKLPNTGFWFGSNDDTTYFQWLHMNKNGLYTDRNFNFFECGNFTPAIKFPEETALSEGLLDVTTDALYPQIRVCGKEANSIATVYLYLKWKDFKIDDPSTHYGTSIPTGLLSTGQPYMNFDMNNGGLKQTVMNLDNLGDMHINYGSIFLKANNVNTREE